MCEQRKFLNSNCNQGKTCAQAAGSAHTKNGWAWLFSNSPSEVTKAADGVVGMAVMHMEGGGKGSGQVSAAYACVCEMVGALLSRDALSRSDSLWRIIMAHVETRRVVGPKGVTS